MTDKSIIFSGPMVRALLDGRKTQTRRVLKPRPQGTLVSVSRDKWMSEEPSEATGGMRQVDPWRPLPYAPGDRLYVREAFSITSAPSCHDGFVRYEADKRCWETGPNTGDIPDDNLVAWFRDIDRSRRSEFAPVKHPSIHMPRWASRLTLTVTDVRVQRLQEISDEDARAEGVRAEVGPTWWQGYRKISDDPEVPLLHQDAPGDAPPDWMIEPKPAGRSKWMDRSAVQNFEALWNSLHGPDAWAANPWVVALTFTVDKRNIDGPRP